MEEEDCISDSVTGTENISPLSPADCPMVSTSQFSLDPTEVFRCQIALEDIDWRWGTHVQLSSGFFSQGYYISGPGRWIKRISRIGVWNKSPPLVVSSWLCHLLLSPLPPGALLCGIEVWPRMKSCKEALDDALPMGSTWKLSPASRCAHLQSIYMVKTNQSFKITFSEQSLPVPHRAGPWLQSLLSHLSAFSSVQLIHAWLIDVAGAVYGHGRCFLLGSAFVCRELI